MPSDYAIHPDLLVHWTGGKDIEAKYKPDWDNTHPDDISSEVDKAYLRRLRDILEFGLWMKTHEAYNENGIHLPPAECLCFTELKLSHSRTHARQYGRLGIAVKRPFLFRKSGRPVIYFENRNKEIPVFLRDCLTDLKNKKLLQFFKPFDSGRGRRMSEEYYSESEWRIIAGVDPHEDAWITDPRKTKDADVKAYFKALSPERQEDLRYLVPLNGWLAAIIYPSVRIKNKAQEEGSEVRRLIYKIANTKDHAWKVEGVNLPVEIDLDLCRNL